VREEAACKEEEEEGVRHCGDADGGQNSCASPIPTGFVCIKEKRGLPALNYKLMPSFVRLNGVCVYLFLFMTTISPSTEERSSR